MIEQSAYIEVRDAMSPEEWDRMYMQLALGQAQLAARMGETPVGAVLVQNGTVLSFGCNRRETDRSPLAHAEIFALRDAAARLGGWRILNATLYVTVEPCAMCAGAILNARIQRVVFGAANEKSGSFGSVADLAALPYPHRLQVDGGVCAQEATELLRRFFERLRQKRAKRVSESEG